MISLPLSAGLIGILKPDDIDDVAAVTPTPLPEKAVTLTGPSPKEVAKLFLHATQQAERSKLVKDADRVDQIMRDFYEKGAGLSEKVINVTPIELPDQGPDVCECYEVKMEGGKSRILTLVAAEGRAQVDFEAYSLHGSAPWEMVLSGLISDPSEMRVVLQIGDYYNYGFSNEQEWQCFIATSPDLEKPVYFYLKRSDDHTDLTQELADGRPITATVKISSHANSHEKRQFELTNLLSRSWVALKPIVP